VTQSPFIHLQKTLYNVAITE